MNFKKILIAVDSDPLSIKTAKIGFDLVLALDAEAALLFVVNRNKESMSAEAGPTREESEMILLKQAEDTLAQMEKLHEGAKALSKFTPEGFPKDVILATAKEWEADLIVMGTHGRSGLSHLFQGSIAEHTVKHATVPVMVIPPEMKED